ncbi:Nucleotidylyl transferase [Venustampulla echinocandica]|uniref:Nucleotidylyl transferase n=1 Tax=Venustampulla echinocandica TaxID=2656787 RepID=A0A370TFB6_9HELO|nr:Nucleotidylyl transferase [Venustampulla echinocandica]RDL33580.1 Nucleotidylyl transferase [Venustampulla echinocandica]
MAKVQTSLLLLPPPPSLLNAASVAAAYEPSILATVTALRKLEAHTELQVALPCPDLHGRLGGPRSQIWGDIQHLLAIFYSLFCHVCAKHGVDIDSDTAAPGSVDARVILLDYDRTLALPDGGEDKLDTCVVGPIIDLPTLAMTRRQWNIIFSVDGEEGQKLLATYQSLANRSLPPLTGHVYMVGGGLAMIQRDPEPSRPCPSPSSSHTVVALGGTFDHLHAGHKLLLTAAALLLQPASKTSTVARRLIIGITGDELLKNKKYAEHIRSWKQRQDDVVDFLLSILSFTRSSRQAALQTRSLNEPIPNGRAVHTTLRPCSITIECVEIQDPFGPTITDESVTALVVSSETRSGGQAVNDKRVEKAWNALEVFEVDVLDAEGSEDSGIRTESFESKISSTAIRKRLAESTRGSSL